MSANSGAAAEMASVGRGRNAEQARYLGNDTEVMLIALVASDILMSAEEVCSMSMLMEAGDLEEFFCLERATAFHRWRAPPVV